MTSLSKRRPNNAEGVKQEAEGRQSQETRFVVPSEDINTSLFQEPRYPFSSHSHQRQIPP